MDELSQLRIAKDPLELLLLSRNAQHLSAVLDGLSAMAPTSESEVLAVLCSAQVAAGAEGMSFDPSIAAGPERARLSWAGVTTRSISEQDHVVVDCGLRLRHYCSDLAVSWCGRPGAAWLSARDACETFHSAVRGAEPGTLTSTHALIARYEDIFGRAGFDTGLLNPLGHGIGLEVHEAPYLTKRREEPLVDGTTLCLEPGVNDATCAYRDERMYLVTDGCFVDLARERVVSMNTDRPWTVAQ